MAQLTTALSVLETRLGQAISDDLEVVVTESWVLVYYLLTQMICGNRGKRY